MIYSTSTEMRGEREGILAGDGGVERREGV